MVVRIRKKNSRQRAGTTHGWGSMKKHRGAGNRGGRGMAGTGKRGDAMKPSIWKEKYFGGKGFTKKNIKPKLTPVNVSYFEEHLSGLLEQKQVTDEKGIIVIDADKLGLKILGDGQVTKKLRITASQITEKAKQKIKEAGGEVIMKETKEAAKTAEVKEKPALKDKAK